MSKIPDASSYTKPKSEFGVGYLISRFKQPVYDEATLWQMLEAGRLFEKEHAFVVIMVRVGNGWTFSEPEPLDRAYQVLYDLGDRATMGMIRHFVATSGLVFPNAELTALFGPRQLQWSAEPKPCVDPLPVVDPVTIEAELVAALRNEEPPLAETMFEPGHAPRKQNPCGKKARKAAARGEEKPKSGFRGKTPAFAAG